MHLNEVHGPLLPVLDVKLQSAAGSRRQLVVVVGDEGQDAQQADGEQHFVLVRGWVGFKVSNIPLLACYVTPDARISLA